GRSSRGNASEATGKFSPRARFATEATSSMVERSRFAVAPRNFHAFVAASSPTRPFGIRLKPVGGSRPAPNRGPPERPGQGGGRQERTGQGGRRHGRRGGLLRRRRPPDLPSPAVPRPSARLATPGRP